LTKPFDSDSICRIIEVCSRSGVREFSGRGIKVSFGQVAQTPAYESVYVPEALERAQDTQARESQFTDELKIRDSELDQMVIEDPSRFEELLRSGDLDDEKT
jgi:hypothetical protein